MHYLLGNFLACLPLLLLGLVLLRELGGEVGAALLLFLDLNLFLIFLWFEGLALFRHIEHELSHAAGVLLSVDGFWL